MEIDEIWKQIGRIDNIFGILGGITMLWGFIDQIIRHANKTKTETHKILPSAKSFSASILSDAVEHAREPIGCSMIVGTIFLLIAIFIARLRTEDPLFYAFTMSSNVLSSIFISLVIGSLINFIAKTSGTPTKWAVWIAVPLGSTTLFWVDYQTGATTEWAWFTIELAFLGSILGSVLGLALEKKPISKYPDGSWERARELAVHTFKDRINRYRWTLETIQIDSYTCEKGKGTLVVTILQLKRGPGLLSENYWPVERYSLTIARNGEILQMRSLQIQDSEKFKDPLKSYLG